MDEIEAEFNLLCAAREMIGFWQQNHPHCLYLDRPCVKAANEPLLGIHRRSIRENEDDER